MKVDDEILGLVREIAKAVGELPDGVQEAAFQFLLEYHLGQRRGSAASADVHASPAVDEESADWAVRLAKSAGVSAEQVQSLVAVDNEGRIHVVRPDLGDREAHRNRNVTVLALWAARVLNRDVYYPATEVRRMVKELKLPPRNLVNNIRRHPNIRSLTLHGKQMLQLVGNWEESVAEIFARYAT
jgi:hypothetical protein